jgi:hypothetical protein
MCDYTGKVTSYVYESETHEWVSDGYTLCECQYVEPVVYEEV